jgi:hypothetical protein
MLPNFASLGVCDARRQCVPTSGKDAIDEAYAAAAKAAAHSARERGAENVSLLEEEAEKAAAEALVRVDLPPDLTRIDGLSLRPSTVTFNGSNKPIGQYGLFTSNAITQGAFIGFYTGVFFSYKSWYKFKDEKAGVHKTWEHYAIASSGEAGSQRSSERRNNENVVLVSPTRALHASAPSSTSNINGVAHLSRFPMSATNEPSGTLASNVYILPVRVSELYEECEDEPGCGGNIHTIAFAAFACIDIDENSELLWNYGAGYAPIRKELDYRANKACVGYLADIKEAQSRVDKIWNECNREPGERLELSKYLSVYRLKDEDTDIDSSESESHNALLQLCPELWPFRDGWPLEKRRPNPASTRAGLRSGTHPEPV